jgi:predicted small secreted protein
MSAVKKTIYCVVVFLTVCCMFAGCHTVKGAGEDIERGGQKIQEEAIEHEH